MTVPKEPETDHKDSAFLSPLESKRITSTEGENFSRLATAHEKVPGANRTRSLASFRYSIFRLLSRYREQRPRRLWQSIRLWCRQRPFWGSLLMLLGSLLILWGPVSLMRFAFFPGSTIWAGLLVGAILFVMGLIQLLAPSYSLITGAIGIVVSLISLLVALGGLGVGMLLGIIGSCLGVAWRPGPRPAPPTSHKRSSFSKRGRPA